MGWNKKDLAGVLLPEIGIRHGFFPARDHPERTFQTTS